MPHGILMRNLVDDLVAEVAEIVGDILRGIRPIGIRVGKVRFPADVVDVELVRVESLDGAVIRNALGDRSIREILEALLAFKQKNRLPYPLLSDESRHISEAFGVPTILGMTHRQTFLIRERKIVWRDLRASTRWQARDVLAALEKLG